MNWLTRLFVRDEPQPRPYATVERFAEMAHPLANDPCPGCGCEHFADGGGVVNGRRGSIVNASRVVRCLNCGEDWFGTPQGWRKPHESALPPAWSAMRAAERHHREQQELLRERGRTRDDAGTPSRRRAPNEGFRRPPVSDET